MNPLGHSAFFSKLAITTCLAALLVGCSLDPSKGRVIDPDKEFSELPAPEVPTVVGTIEKAAKEAEAMGQYGKAAQLYRQLVDKDKNNIGYQMSFAENLRRSDDCPSAISIYDIVLQQQPNNLDAGEGKALCIMQDGRMTEAGRLLGDVLKADKTRWRTLNALGILFASKGLVDEAMVYFMEAQSRNPTNPSIPNNMGLAYAVDHNYRKAIESLDRALRLPNLSDDQRSHIEMNMAMVYGIAGDMEKAKAMASKYLTGPALDNNLGLYAHLARNDSLAKSYLNSALSESPRHYERAWRNLDIIEEESKGAAPSPDKSMRLPIAPVIKSR